MARYDREVSTPEQYMRRAIELSLEHMQAGDGGPFGCVVVRDGEVVAEGHNRVTSSNDPTAHAEVTAIRGACRVLDTFNLAGCELFTSCEPCPMCLGAIYWARLDRVFYANTKVDAAAVGFDDAFIYDELALPIGGRKVPFVSMLRDEALAVFRAWDAKVDKVRY